MNLNRDELLSQLRQINEYEFEQLVSEVWEQQGWQTTVTSGSNDRGIDVIAKKSNPFTQKHLIQAKRYSEGNRIGSPDIQQYSSLRAQENDVDAIIVITTSSFSSQAEQAAEDLNVKLISGEELCEIIVNSGSVEIVYNYVDEFIDKLEYKYEEATKLSNKGEVPHLRIMFEHRDVMRSHLAISFETNQPLCNIAGLDSKEIIISEYIAKEHNLSVVSKLENEGGKIICVKGDEDIGNNKMVEIINQILSDVYQIGNKNKCEIDLEH